MLDIPIKQPFPLPACLGRRQKTFGDDNQVPHGSEGCFVEPRRRFGRFMPNGWLGTSRVQTDDFFGRLKTIGGGTCFDKNMPVLYISPCIVLAAPRTRLLSTRFAKIGEGCV